MTARTVSRARTCCRASSRRQRLAVHNLGLQSPGGCAVRPGTAERPTGPASADTGPCDQDACRRGVSGGGADAGAGFTNLTFEGAWGPGPSR